jgi:NTE family protein
MQRRPLKRRRKVIHDSKPPPGENSIAPPTLADVISERRSNRERAGQAKQVMHDQTVLVLQGGGALGAYQAGVYEGMAEQGIAPDWVTGVSIGAINGALIAGNPAEVRLDRLREFWNRVSSGIPPVALAQFDPLRIGLNRLSALTAAAFGVPGFFSPRMPPALFALDGTPQALSVYETEPLRKTLEELIDFDYLNREEHVRLSMGSVNVHTGNSIYFDNGERKLGPEHVMASGSLPPGFPSIMIDGDHYWDGGIVSNSPLSYVLDDSPDISALIVQVDLFSAKGELPVNLDQVLEREKDIRYSSKTRFNTKRVQELENLRHALGRLMKKIPAELYDDPDYKLLQPVCEQKRHITIAHLINRRFTHSTNSKDYEFSRTTVRQLWEAGLEDVRRTCAHPEWIEATEVVGGVRVFDLSR